MGRRHFKPEQIIQMLREAEIKLAGGKASAKNYIFDKPVLGEPLTKIACG